MTVINPFANIGAQSASSRVHVNRAAHWSRSGGTDFWYREDVAGTAADDLITNYGWTTTTLAYVLGSAAATADLLSSGDVGTTGVTSLDGTTSDLLASPAIFGDYAHGLLAGNILGYTPTVLNLEVYAAFPVAATAETPTGFGFSSGTSLTATNHVAFIHPGATNFAIRSTPGTTTFIDSGALVDNAYHLWKMSLTAGSTAEWFMDGTSQGTITLVTDLYPVSFMASVVNASANTLKLAWAHVWYS